MPGRWIQVRKMKEQEADGDLAGGRGGDADHRRQRRRDARHEGHRRLERPPRRPGHDHRLLRRRRPAQRPPAPVGRRVPPLLHDVRRAAGPQPQPGHGAGRLPAPPARRRHRVQDLRLHGQRQPVRRRCGRSSGRSCSPATTARRRWSASTGATRSTTRPSRSRPQVRRALGFEDVVRFEHHITETWKSIVRQPYDRRDELVELAGPRAEHLGQARGRRPGGRRRARPPVGHPRLLPGQVRGHRERRLGRPRSSTSWTRSTRRTTRRAR